MKSLRHYSQTLAQYEIFIAGSVVLASMVVISWLPWAALVLGLFWGLRWAAWGKPSVRTPADVPLLILTLLLPVNAAISPIPETSTPQLFRLLVGIGLFYAVVNMSRGNWLTQRKTLSWLVWLLALGTVALAFSSLFSVEWATYKFRFIPQFLYSFTRIEVGDTIHPNVLDGTLVILVPLMLGWVLFGGREVRGWEKGLLGILVLVVVGIMVLAQSRGSILALGGAVVVLVLLRWRWGWVGVGVGSLAVAGAVWRIGMPQTLDMILVSATLGGADLRMQIWRRALYMIQDFPFTGIGMGLYGDVAQALYPFPGPDPKFIPHAHQLFLQVAVDMGIPGFLAWFAVFVIVSIAGWQAYRMARKQDDHVRMGLTAGLLASQVALTVHGFLDAVTWGMVRPAPIVWGLWGLTMALWLTREPLEVNDLRSVP